MCTLRLIEPSSLVSAFEMQIEFHLKLKSLAPDDFNRICGFLMGFKLALKRLSEFPGE